ncbi:MAG: SOS response-associated peptidase family protein [Bacteroidia bacterium]|nr:SOS response-associated peptidase family protein [Bacteroidia bacterium]
MVTAYTFNTQYRPAESANTLMPSLRLLEGGRFAPRQFAPVLIQEYGQTRLKFFQWGLVPAWSKHDLHPRYFAPVAQTEQNPIFQLPLRRNRCLIPADGFYTDGLQAGSRQTYKYTRDDGDTFCFAGIYDTWRQRDGSLLYSFALMTTDSPAGTQSRLGLQMPLILAPAQEKKWLDTTTPADVIDRIIGAPVQRLSLVSLPVLQLDLPEYHYEQAAA